MMKKPTILCVIPSRLGSTRLSRKPLLPIKSKPMIQWVYENACRAPFFSKVIVATDSHEIADVIIGLGGDVMMTDPHIRTGTDRVATVAAHYPEADVVVNLQGDEPFITPSMLHTLVLPYLDSEDKVTPDMTTLASPLLKEFYTDPGAVKVILDQKQYAIYFSRAPIPFYRSNELAPVYHHKGLYAFRRDFLLHYVTLPKTPLEETESLEQLRAIENGHRILVCLTEEKTLEINTQEEYEAAQHFVY